MTENKRDLVNILFMVFYSIILVILLILNFRVANSEEIQPTSVPADVITPSGNVADILIAEGHGRPYAGGKRGSWCQSPQSNGN